MIGREYVMHQIVVVRMSVRMYEITKAIQFCRYILGIYNTTYVHVATAFSYWLQIAAIYDVQLQKIKDGIFSNIMIVQKE